MEFLCSFPFLLIWAAGTLFWIWMLVDCLTNEPSVGNDKLVWALVIVFLNGFGALLYYFVRRPQRERDRQNGTRHDQY